MKNLHFYRSILHLQVYHVLIIKCLLHDIKLKVIYDGYMKYHVLESVQILGTKMASDNLISNTMTCVVLIKFDLPLTSLCEIDVWRLIEYTHQKRFVVRMLLLEC